MLPIVVHADAELAVIDYLCGVSQLTTLCAAGRIAAALPSHPVFPAVLITRVGGQDIWPALDEAVIAVDVYGTDKGNAAAVMATVRGALLAISNDSVPGAVLVSAVEENGPQWLPDTIPVPPVPRYTARFRVITHT
jgi:hypothetical protein